MNDTFHDTYRQHRAFDDGFKTGLKAGEDERVALAIANDALRNDLREALCKLDPRLRWTGIPGRDRAVSMTSKRVDEILAIIDTGLQSGGGAMIVDCREYCWRCQDRPAERLNLCGECREELRDENNEPVVSP